LSGVRPPKLAVRKKTNGKPFLGAYLLPATAASILRAAEIPYTMLSWPYAHLLINHFPVVLSVSALSVAILAYLLQRRGLWLTAMGALTAAGVFVYPVFLTGAKADNALNDPWFVRPGAINAHDDAALFALWVILIAGAFAAYCWWRSVKHPADVIPVWMRAGVFVGALLSVTVVARTSYLGGKIVHDSPVLHLEQPPPGLPAGIVADTSKPAGP
jgi:uncharacterized membrane protein